MVRALPRSIDVRSYTVVIMDAIPAAEREAIQRVIETTKPPRRRRKSKSNPRPYLFTEVRFFCGLCPSEIRQGRMDVGLDGSLRTLGSLPSASGPGGGDTWRFCCTARSCSFERVVRGERILRAVEMRAGRKGRIVQRKIGRSGRVGVRVIDIHFAEGDL